MATEMFNSFKNYKKRTVGNLNSIRVRTLNHGAVCTEDIDNFTIVELGFNDDGERTASYLKDVANKGYLIASVERRYLDENIDAFFNGKGEKARIVHLEEGLRFETSAFKSDEEVKAGQFAHFDPATKKFVIHDGSHEDYADAVDKFVVTNSEDNMAYTLGQPLVQLEVLASVPTGNESP